MKKQKTRQDALDKRLLARNGKKLNTVISALLADNELDALLELANIVSIKRLGFNDHGRVHARIVALNALTLLDLIHAKTKTSLEEEGIGDFEDSQVVAVVAGFVHDVGMSTGRYEHEMHGLVLLHDIVMRILTTHYEPAKARVMHAMIQEAVAGHMGTRPITSIEGGVVPIADGCDITKGRSRIPLRLSEQAHKADIHEFSANAIQSVSIEGGREKAIHITAIMDNPAGLFQIEQILLPKIKVTPLKNDVRVLARIGKKTYTYL
ncbi:phosphohydrolase [archaeon CG10_big_fil_rev_8_21_14_0_10_43_11]|nr:MAG: phosphohydrolase [archaeon CG10_big_fil_rev_8_21_14_0_10_43_11]